MVDCSAFIVAANPMTLAEEWGLLNYPSTKTGVSESVYRHGFSAWARLRTAVLATSA